jgi:hypothetical protein
MDTLTARLSREESVSVYDFATTLRNFVELDRVEGLPVGDGRPDAAFAELVLDGELDVGPEAGQETVALLVG